jgi:N utilization substance protein A
VRNVVTELGGEKVDIIPLDADPARFLAKSLSPARVREVEIDDAEQKATVIVPDDQVAMAIGAGGQNVRLTAKLTGWKIDILSESQFAQLRQFESEEAEGGVDGRCTAVLGNGRRCPNAALVASTYCGLPRHAVLVHFDTHSVKILHGIENEEVQDLLEGRREEEIVARANELNFEVYDEDQKAHQTASEERQRQEELSSSIAGAEE